MDAKMPPHRIALLVLEGFVLFDLSIPYSLFKRVRLANKVLPYEVMCCAEQAETHSHDLRLGGCRPLSALAEADTIIVPGLEAPQRAQSAAVVEALQAAHARGARLVAIGTGAYVLAQAGILKGVRATTHWSVADAMAAAYPELLIDPNALFVDDGQVLTCAGLASGLDLCLYLIQKDFGAAAAQRCAQFLIIPNGRAGSRRQRVLYASPRAADRLNNLIYWLLENLNLDHTLGTMAAQAGLSLRTLNRKFNDHYGRSPMGWLTDARLRRAQVLLESTSLSVEQITTATGFHSAAGFRAQFHKSKGLSPSAWRKSHQLVRCGGSVSLLE